jgi:hypothetical protein
MVSQDSLVVLATSIVWLWGDFSLAEEGIGPLAVPFMWILFILSTVLNMIIMLNLLIAIISESFTNINSVAS